MAAVAASPSPTPPATTHPPATNTQHTYTVSMPPGGRWGSASNTVPLAHATTAPAHLDTCPHMTAQVVIKGSGLNRYKVFRFHPLPQHPYRSLPLLRALPLPQAPEDNNNRRCSSQSTSHITASCDNASCHTVRYPADLDSSPCSASAQLAWAESEKVVAERRSSKQTAAGLWDPRKWGQPLSPPTKLSISHRYGYG